MLIFMAVFITLFESIICSGIMIELSIKKSGDNIFVILWQNFKKYPRKFQLTNYWDNGKQIQLIT
jgi:hypothetical protein